ncbi:hypothetical protein HAX54_052702 [Datura stramonium]|uniref:Uncharacterized protein n=1 Tax=Datura stramonium TaxID=4076 RepID=A0ABS8T1J6_DATST|nr:hypothetical protein [Datura stramonium]
MMMAQAARSMEAACAYCQARGSFIMALLATQCGRRLGSMACARQPSPGLQLATSDQPHEDGTSRTQHGSSLRILPGAKRLHHGATSHTTRQDIRLNGMREAAFAWRYSLHDAALFKRIGTREVALFPA